MYPTAESVITRCTLGGKASRRLSGIAVVLPAYPVCDDESGTKRDDEQRKVLVVRVFLEDIQNLNKQNSAPDSRFSGQLTTHIVPRRWQKSTEKYGVAGKQEEQERQAEDERGEHERGNLSYCYLVTFSSSSCLSTRPYPP